MSLPYLDLWVEPTREQLSILQRAVAGFCAEIERTGSSKPFAQGGFIATADYINNGYMRFASDGHIKLTAQHVIAEPLGALRVLRNPQIPVDRLLSAKVCAQLLRSAAILWRAPRWVIRVYFAQPVRDATQGGTPKREKKKRAVAVAGRNRRKRLPTVDEIYKKILAKKRRQLRERIGYIPPKKKRRGSLILRTNARFVSGGLPSLGKRH